MNIAPGDDLYCKNSTRGPYHIDELESENSAKYTNLNRAIWKRCENEGILQGSQVNFISTRFKTNREYFEEYTKTITPLDYRNIDKLK